MSDFAKDISNTVSPNYLSKLELSRPPFSNRQNEVYFYKSKNIQSIIDKIEVLIESTNLTLFIQGVSGLGKTTLLNYLQTNGKENWRFCSIESTNITDANQLASKITQDFHLKFSSGNTENTQIDSLIPQLDNLQSENIIPILLLDNIDDIDESISIAIKALLETPNAAQPLIRIVVAGNDIPEHFIDALPKNDDDRALKYLPLPPLSEKETQEYIAHRLSGANFKKNFPFDKALVKKVYLDSKGFPKYINYLADHLLCQVAQGKIKKKISLDVDIKNNHNNLLKAFAAALIICVGIGVMLIDFNGDDSHAINEDTDNHLTRSLPLPERSELKNTSTPTQVKDPAIKSEEPALIKPKENVVSQADKSSSIQARQAKDDSPSQVTSKKEISSPSQIAANWIDQQNPKHYTLQLIGSSKINACINFIEKHNLSSDAYVFKTIRKGKDWYSVIYRSFENFANAKAETKNLPPSLRKVKPWIRPFSHIQKAISKR